MDSLASLYRMSALAAALGAAPLLSHAQSWRVEPTISASTTATRTGVSGSTSIDGEVSATPSVIVRGRGAQYRIDADASLQGLLHVASEKANRVLPRGTLSLNVVPVDHWVNVDSSVSVDQTDEDPYALQGTSQLVTTTRYRLGPAVEHQLTSNLSLRVRSDNLWTRRTSSGSIVDRDSRAEHTFARLEQRPTPLGGWIEASRERTYYVSNSLSGLDLDSIRGALSYSPSPDLIWGFSGGSERTRLSSERSIDVTYGVDIDWRPNERTSTKVNIERHFFGAGGAAELLYRSPFGAIVANLRRGTASQPTSILLTPPGGDLANLLNSIYTTRISDAEQRRAAVNDIISKLGLTPVLSGPVEVFSNYVQLQQSASLYASLAGSRTLVSFGIFSIKSEILRREGSAQALLNLDAGADTEQRGWSIESNRRITQSTSVNLGIQSSRIVGLGIRQGDRSNEKIVALRADESLSPRTSIFCGVRRRVLASNVAEQAQESAIFFGVRYRL